MFETGQVVTTPEGNIGQITRPQSGSRFDYYDLSGSDMNIAVYAVMLDSGKVEHWTEAALTGDVHVRRSGSLQ